MGRKLALWIDCNADTGKWFWYLKMNDRDLLRSVREYDKQDEATDAGYAGIHYLGLDVLKEGEETVDV